MSRLPGLSSRGSQRSGQGSCGHSSSVDLPQHPPPQLFGSRPWEWSCSPLPPEAAQAGAQHRLGSALPLCAPQELLAEVALPAGINFTLTASL